MNEWSSEGIGAVGGLAMFCTGMKMKMLGEGGRGVGLGFSWERRRFRGGYACCLPFNFCLDGFPCTLRS